LRAWNLLAAGHTKSALTVGLVFYSTVEAPK
jgi:hypothetical protein